MEEMIINNDTQTPGGKVITKDNVKAIFDKYFNEEMTHLLNSNMKFYKRIVDNDKLKSRLKTALFDLVYHEYAKSKNKKINAYALTYPPNMAIAEKKEKYSEKK